MSKGVFVTATGTDVGKTYITALLVKKMRESGYNTGYYKAALSGAESVSDSDAGYVNRIAGIGQNEDTLVSYIYKTAVSPHLAARLEGNPPDLDRIAADYAEVSRNYDYIAAEGSGGIVCPVRWDDSAHILLEDVIRKLGLGAVIVADAGLGTINSAVLTAEYMKNRNIEVRGIILNRFNGSIMHCDNAAMIEELAGVPIIAKVGENDEDMNASGELLETLFR